MSKMNREYTDLLKACIDVLSILNAMVLDSDNIEFKPYVETISYPLQQKLEEVVGMREIKLTEIK